MDNGENILARYLDGELSVEEKQILEKNLVSNPELQQELERLRISREAIRLFGLKEQVSVIHKQMMQELAPKKNRKQASRIIRYTMGVAASLLLIVGGWLAYNFVTLSSDKVFASRYQSYELANLRDGSADETAIEKAYHEKNYKEVLSLNKSEKAPSINENFLCGAAALELKENTRAIDCFRNVLLADKTAKQPLLKDEAEYYLALSYLRNKDYDFALELMKNIKSDPNHLYQQKVTNKLIRQVKMLKWK